MHRKNPGIRKCFTWGILGCKHLLFWASLPGLVALFLLSSAISRVLPVASCGHILLGHNRLDCSQWASRCHRCGEKVAASRESGVQHDATNVNVDNVAQNLSFKGYSSFLLIHIGHICICRY